jgi:acyl-coenzyme A synthetase/AMP-(fatty) acid ligase
VLGNLLNSLKNDPEETFLIWRNTPFSNGWLYNAIAENEIFLSSAGINRGDIVVLKSDYSPLTIALLIALIKNRNIILPVLPSSKNIETYINLAKANFIIRVENEKPAAQTLTGANNHPFIQKLHSLEHPGLILATSGTTGEPKLIVHDLQKFLTKYTNARKRFTTLAFLLFDHIAGLDTLFYSLFSTGTLVVPEERGPAYICELIEKFKVEVLPASPSFLNLLLLSEEYRRFDFLSLRIITFGSEPMPEVVLQKVKNTFPNIKIVQKYGISELGSPISKSKEDDPQWIKFRSDHFQIRIIDDELWIKSETAMMGYLNEEAEFTEDGWFNTGDKVILDESGEYIRILGRNSDIINIGGEKVFPGEIENVLLQIDDVVDAIVYADPHLILGNMIIAKIKVKESVKDRSELIKKIKLFCKDKLEPFKIPQKFSFTTEDLFGERIKKERR